MREGSGVSCHFILSSCEHPKVEVCERLKKLEHSAQINQNGDVNRATVFIDFDHTLAHTTFLKWWERQAPEGRARFRHGMFNAATLLRPGAKELVTELSRDYQLVCLTLGKTSFQRDALRAIGLLPMFHNVCGLDYDRQVQCPEVFVLLDDNEPHARGTMEKFFWLGFHLPAQTEEERRRLLDRHYIQVEKFAANGEAETGALPLTYILETIREKLRAQLQP